MNEEDELVAQMIADVAEDTDFGEDTEDDLDEETEDITTDDDEEDDDDSEDDSEDQDDDQDDDDEDDDEDSDDEEANVPAKKPKRNSAERRIAQMTYKQKVLEAEKADLAERIAKLESKPATAPKAEETLLKPEDFPDTETYVEYRLAKVEEAKAATQVPDQQPAQQDLKAMEADLSQRYAKNSVAAEARHEDYAEVIRGFDPKINMSDGVRAHLLGGIAGPETMYAIANDPELMFKMRSAPKDQVDRAIAKIHDNIHAQITANGANSKPKSKGKGKRVPKAPPSQKRSRKTSYAKQDDEAFMDSFASLISG